MNLLILILEPGNQEMMRMDNSQERVEVNGNDEGEPENHEHLISRQDLVSVDQVGGGSLGDGAGSLPNHSEKGSAPHTNKEGTSNTAVDSNLQSKDIKQENKEEDSVKIKEEPSEVVTPLGLAGGMGEIIYIDISDEEENQLPKPSTSKRKQPKRKTAKKGKATTAPSWDGDQAHQE